MTIAIVCGGRDYADAARLAKVLDAAVDRLGLHTVIVGRAKGADTLAEAWAMSRPDINVIACPADWETHGKKAGAIRNRFMLAVLKGAEDPERYVLAFPGGAGTDQMVDIAGREPGVKVKRV